MWKCIVLVVCLSLSTQAFDVKAQAQMIAAASRNTAASAGDEYMRFVVTQDKMSQFTRGQTASAATASLSESLKNAVDKAMGSIDDEISLRGLSKEKTQSKVNMLTHVGVAVVDVPTSMGESNAAELVRDLMNVENVRAVEADIMVQLDADNDPIFKTEIEFIKNGNANASESVADPLAKQLWGMQHIGAKVAWVEAALPLGHHRPRIAVIDTGVLLEHPDLKSNMFVNCKELYGEEGVDDDENGYVDDIYGWNAIDNHLTPNDDNKHGTHVAGTIGAVTNNGLGVFGAHQKPIIVPCKFLNRDGGGYLSNAVECIDYSLAVEAYISCNSYGSQSTTLFLKSAIDRAQLFGQLFVSAAGNDGGDPWYPAAFTDSYDNVLAVAAIDQYDQKAEYSCHDPIKVQVAAPGSSVLSTCLNDDYCTLSGTSMAAPHVAGAAGLMKSIQPLASYHDLKDLIFRSTKPFVDWQQYVTYGTLDLAMAIAMLNDGYATTSTTTSTTTSSTKDSCSL